VATQPLFSSNIGRNPDVAATQGFFKSGFEHFMNFGMAENRVGAVIEPYQYLTRYIRKLAQHISIF
jgi:hypothetical protein